MQETTDRTQFLARLGAAMAGASYPVTFVRQTLERVSAGYGQHNEVVALPNNVQVVGPTSREGTPVASASVGSALRFDQTFPLAQLVTRTVEGRVSPAEGQRDLNRIIARRRPYPAWVTVLGYGVFSAGLALVMEPTVLNLVAATVLGFMVGVMWTVSERVPVLAPVTPVLAAVLVAGLCIVGAQYLSLDHVGLRALIPPLAVFLPGLAITVSVIELAAGDVISGASRLVAGFMQLAQLAFGIFIASHMLGLDDAQLTSQAVNKLGPWAPWLGVGVFVVGIMLFLAPPLAFLPWLAVLAYTAYVAQYLGDLLLGGYTSGFFGALALTVAALMIARRRDSPPAVAMVVPGFWLLVPGSLGLIGVAELFGADGDSALPATLISIIAIAFGVQAGLVAWQLVRRRRQRH
ncbi:threonine/serine ThrE exporter family protein [Mycolicibacterium sp. S3B2]|uniref:threonine/serine ThrE exporter family protein n=1 Tax=Mycolicibacterium sp. S3B2 TaxID=3415120 RepID=UPI003C7A80B5